MTKQELLKTAKPIKFTTDMVHAILREQNPKTQTRRPIEPQPDNECQEFAGLFDCNEVSNRKAVHITEAKFINDSRPPEYCFRKPRYKVGDVLYVRETWANHYYDQFGMLNVSEKVLYKADGEYTHMVWKSSTTMPKEAARLFLRVTDVRVEQLNDVTVENIEKEGFYCDPMPDYGGVGGYKMGMKIHFTKYIHRKYGNGECIKGYNPWLWAYEFERIVTGTEDEV